LGVVIGLMSAEDDVLVEDEADDAADETMTLISPPPKPLDEDDLPLFLLWKSGDTPSR
jgi:hypothetical protein